MLLNQFYKFSKKFVNIKKDLEVRNAKFKTTFF